MRGHVEILADHLEVRADGISTAVPFDAIGHIELRDRRTVVLGFGLDGGPLHPHVVWRPGRLHAEDRFDQLAGLVTSRHYSTIELGELRHSDETWFAAWIEQRGSTREVRATATDERTLTLQAGGAEFACDLGDRGAIDPEIRIRSGGATVLRISEGRALSESGMVIGTFDRFAFRVPGKRARTRGFRARLPDGQEIAYHAFARRLHAPALEGAMAATDDGLALTIDADIPTRVALMLFAMTRFIARHDGLPTPAPLRSGTPLVAETWRSALGRFGLILLALFAAAWVSAWLDSGVQHLLIGAAIGGTLGPLFALLLVPVTSRLFRLTEGCWRVPRGLHFGATEVRFCGGIFGHSPPLSYFDLGHVETRRFRVVCRMASGVDRRPTHAFSLFVGGARRDQLLDMLTSHAPGRLWSRVEGGVVRHSHAFEWDSILPGTRSTSEVRVLPKESGCRLRVDTGARTFTLLKGRSRVVMVRDAAGSTPLLVLSGKTVSLFSGCHVGDVKQDREAFEFVLPDGLAYRLDKEQGIVFVAHEPLARIQPHGLGCVRPIPEVLAVALLCLVQVYAPSLLQRP